MVESAFPILYVRDVARSVAFYAGRLGFAPGYRWPPEGEGQPQFVVLGAGESTIAVATDSAPERLLGLRVGTEPRFELCVYVADVDATIVELRSASVPVLREPADMEWGERMAYVADPDGNPVQITARAAG